MPVYDPEAQKSDIARWIESMVKSIPGAKYIIPDPYDPSSYLMPIGGLAKAGEKAGSRLFEVIFKRSSTGRILPTVPTEIAFSAQPEKLRTFLNYVERQFPDAVHNQRIKFPIDSISRSVGSVEEGILNAVFKGLNKE